MTLLHAVLLGILEGVTEFLPISSTGHLILASSALGIPTTTFGKTFEIVIQLGAILAVVLLYAQRLVREKRLLVMACIGFIPTGILGLALHDLVRSVFLESPLLVAWSLFLGGIVILLFEWTIGRRAATQHHKITVLQALGVGSAQSLALIPGVSRSAAAIIGGMLLGFSRRDIVDFAFVLAIPTMGAATALDLFQHASVMSSADWSVLGIGCLVSFLTALIAVRWLLRFITYHTFVAFGWYRILIGLLAIILWS